jgi:hypothetical protein
VTVTNPNHNIRCNLPEKKFLEQNPFFSPCSAGDAYARQYMLILNTVNDKDTNDNGKSKTCSFLPSESEIKEFHVVRQEFPTFLGSRGKVFKTALLRLVNGMICN